MGADRQRAPEVIPILADELDDFRTEATEFLAGNRDEMKFTVFRLHQGVYGQRQAERQMIRVKLPFGGVTPTQLEGLAQAAEEFPPLRKGHITTRQSIQMHHVPLARIYDLLRLLGDHGLSSREGCSNTVRNVTGDPWAGVRDDEPFDVTPYAGAFVRYWVRNPLSQSLPRKFKVTFSGSEADAAMTMIHDIGWIARTRVVDGREERGFRMVVGGALSTFPKTSIVISEFVPVEDFLRYSEAVVRVFNNADELRVNILKARLKFLIHHIGEDAFKQLLDEQLALPWAAERPRLDALLWHDDEQSLAPQPSLLDRSAVPEADRGAFLRWVDANVRPQKQEGYYAIEVLVPQGDLDPEQFRGLASIILELGAGRARTTQGQNIVLRWIPGEHLYEAWTRLRALGLARAGAQSLLDVVSCPGTDSCKLGITSSMGLNRAIVERVESMQITDPLVQDILINISGCPNSCGQHHLGNIGFHGAAMREGERQIPAYNVLLGGRRREGEPLRLGQLARLRIPAKRVPDAVERFIAAYMAQRQEGEPFNAFLDRVGVKPFEAAVQDLTVTPAFATSTLQEFIDWEREGLYVLERGEGECAI